MRRLTVGLSLLALLAVSSLVLFAADPFSGTWRVNLSKAQLTQTPITVTYNNGVYKKVGGFAGEPDFTVKPDGVDHADSSNPAYDTVNARMIDSRTLEIVQKKAGRVVNNMTVAASSDARAVVVKFTAYPEARSVSE